MQLIHWIGLDNIYFHVIIIFFFYLSLIDFGNVVSSSLSFAQKVVLVALCDSLQVGGDACAFEPDTSDFSVVYY